MTFTNTKRAIIQDQLQKEHFDLFIIGGGITGTGIALDAAARGMKAGLVDMQDFSAGTSSRSTKLVHGGLRYLKQFEIGMVAEVGKERTIVYENGPHVTTPEKMLLPIYKGGTFGRFTTSIGLRVYDFLAGVKKLERRTMLTKGKVLKQEPLLNSEHLKGGGYYVEYRTDDSRLTIEVAKKAVEKGAVLLNYVKAIEFLYNEKGVVKGVVLEDQLTKKRYKVFARKIINASGPWVDLIREKDHSKLGKTLQLTKGVHLVFDQSRFPLKQAIYFDTPDKRMIFAIPRQGKTYVGTTDTFYEDDPVSPEITEIDVRYLLQSINGIFPSLNLSKGDIDSGWAGVRPLILEEGKGPSEISRKDEIWTSDSGLITIAGGKLTGYRKMAETVVDFVSADLKAEEGLVFGGCQTRNLPISGGDFGGSSKFKAFLDDQVIAGVKAGLMPEDARQIASVYGTNAAALFEIISNRGHEDGKYQLPLNIYAQLIYAVEKECIANAVDFFLRRTGALLFNISLVKKWKGNVIRALADIFHWSEKEKRLYTSQLDTEIAKTQIALGFLSKQT
ncbi:glycerol-3-phosphate dehydrogenase [Peribacillus deserti]|uniref:Glycerol-3-phosphate dehydrogenase n=1 Tax=Peribacillus deserti TaxID=673318 RepID=A0ABS2QIE5_9BACI|nr:FAD-dependent oxidoreductase [Peribacillus deserti]MBM7692494.1 glycerol-3-phosphate dehydrogenase [Peribacillus deserti]